jgi:hypothetical protein
MHILIMASLLHETCGAATAQRLHFPAHSNILRKLLVAIDLKLMDFKTSGIFASRPTWDIASLSQTVDLPQDTWLRERVENNTKELFRPRWHDDVA